jgi:hypothetical protein
MSFLPTMVVAALFFPLFYLVARRRNRDRPWLWGLGAVILSPAIILGFIMYLVHGEWLLNKIAWLCPQCRQPVVKPELRPRVCGTCGSQVSAFSKIASP